MNRRQWVSLVLLPLLFTWGIDRITKFLVENTTDVRWYGYLGIVLHHNHGAMLGFFSELPALLRVVSLATGGAFLLASFLIVQFLLPTESKTLRIGMSFLMGGILGNVADRILTGYVIDFIVFRFGTTFSPAFNLADTIQWVGYFMIVFVLVKDGKSIWPEQNFRKSFWINPRYQIRYIVKFISVALLFGVISIVFSYTYFKVTLNEITGHQTALENRFLIPYLLTFCAIMTAFMSLMFLVSLILSHRSAGPIYAFEKFLEDLFNGKTRSLKLRAGDEHKHLEHLAERLSKKEIIVRDRKGVGVVAEDEGTDTVVQVADDKI